MTAWQPGMTITAGRLMEGPDPVITTTGVVAATGFTLSSFVGRKCGGITQVELAITVATDIAAPSASENIGDTLACTLPEGYRPLGVVSTSWGDGSQAGEATIGTTGLVTIRSVGYATATPAGRNIRISETFITGP
ncbi:hypothetical protein ACFY6U_22800 [Streptomyces sp. NPDC013157]|uniref:hypothetical protein n=1 Tax=Streptomyces sp. NPDC013157 TaxID=3364861 RepID=UPI0036A4993D